MFATFTNRARICIALIERFGIKKVLIAAMEARSYQTHAQSCGTFHRYQVFR